ncbi:hypothetical protein BCV70DRAFT_166486 [Testicularia cyperi]|uniref:Endoplasmic reticulum junction formation protein lunapark n=1 Tax=Testicularia cyperi TaxID=1882483 RepID=A0A317XK45_9BASI|nr:hypothetical protein BCV70DRAFT_166486 [Testicularia cyperi]
MGVFNALVSGSFLPWRRASKETDYETVLSALDRDIVDVQTRLAQIRRRMRRASVGLTIQAFLLWAIYTALCWFFGLLTLSSPSSSSSSPGASSKMLLVWTPVLASPLLIISTRRIVKWWYKRIGAAEEKHLIDLKRRKRDKIDEIKRATRYDHLRMLLDKYDDAGARAGSPSDAGATTPGKKKDKKGQVQMQMQTQAQATGTPAGSAVGNKGGAAAAALQTPQRGGVSSIPPLNTPEGQALQAQRMALMRSQGSGGGGGGGVGGGFVGAVPPPTPMPKTWMDKLADAVLGADPSSLGPEQKYALVCPRCKHHNGLALREEFHELQYICPHCGQFNSRRPSSAPVGSPFAAGGSGLSSNGSRGLLGEEETPTKVKRGAVGGVDGSSRLRMRADADDDDSDDDRPPVATLQDQNKDAPHTSSSLASADSSRDHRLQSLRSRKSTTSTSASASASAGKEPYSMDLDD